METNKIEIEIGPLAFEFENFENWVNKASSKFYGFNPHRIICLDAKKRVCLTGREFMRARDEKSFPIKCYEIVI